MSVNAKIEKRQKLIADMRGLIDAAPNGILSTEDEVKYNLMDEEQEGIKRGIDAEARVAELEKSLDEPQTRKLAANAGAKQEPEQAVKKDDVHMRAFRAYLQGADVRLGAGEFRDLDAGLLTQGGSFIPPVQFVNDFIKAVDDALKFRSMCTVWQVKNAQSLGVPTWDVNPSAAEWTTELTNATADTAMRTGLREFKPLPISKLVKLSRKLLRHSVINAEQLVLQQLAYIMGSAQENAAMTGNGASSWLGVFTASDSGIPTSRDVSEDNAETYPTGDGLINALFSLKEQYQANASWLFHRLVAKAIRKIKDGQGQYMWESSLRAGIPDTLLGRPVIQSEFAPSTLTTGQYVGVVGDFKKYIIVDDVGLMEVERLKEKYATENQDGFICRAAADGQPVLGEAFARVKLA